MREALRLKREGLARRERAGFAEDKLTLEPATQGRAGNARYIEPARQATVHLGHGHGHFNWGRALVTVGLMISIVALTTLAGLLLPPPFNMVASPIIFFGGMIYMAYRSFKNSWEFGDGER